MTDQIDFAEHGRLLGELGAGLVALPEEMVVECGYRPPVADAVDLTLRSIDAYRAVVLAAEHFRQFHANGLDNGVGEIESRNGLFAALARFKNITEKKP